MDFITPHLTFKHRREFKCAFLVKHDSEQLKKKITHLIPEILSLVIWYAVHRKKANLETLLQKLPGMSPSKSEKTLGILVVFVSSILWLGPTLFTIEMNPIFLYMDLN
ncbi:hypothetical protein NPIL_201351 [Nephila pilipes]|uniref:Uncharacterized protein n=1 Tax=Nephila pilipes TaxID=299642 RepID=A0A8X6QLT4_NEPPI|nr:hypothetical protein NPIL_201351 [Nephila pilipes]